MKKSLILLAFVVLVIAAGPTASAANITLFEWGFNIDGAIFGSYSPPVPGDLPSNLNDAAFDWFTGLGSVTISLSGAGSHNVIAYFDHEIDEDINTFFNEFGSTYGVPDGRQSWEIDDPVSGDIYSHFANNTLDKVIFTGLFGGPGDVSMAIGWDFTLAADEEATIGFLVGTTAPTSGFYLQQTDPDSPASIYFSSSLDIGEVGVPEPGTLILLLSGLGFAGVAARFRKSR